VPGTITARCVTALRRRSKLGWDDGHRDHETAAHGHGAGQRRAVSSRYGELYVEVSFEAAETPAPRAPATERSSRPRWLDDPRWLARSPPSTAGAPWRSRRRQRISLSTAWRALPCGRELLFQASVAEPPPPGRQGGLGWCHQPGSQRCRLVLLRSAGAGPPGGAR